MAKFALVKFLFDNTTAVVPTTSIVKFNPDKVGKKKIKVAWVEEDGTKTISMVLLTGRWYLVLLAALTSFVAICTGSSSTAKNHELFQKIGLTRLRAPNTHHRKRLAVESRHHSRSDDSHMFIIKLPPNPHYYAHNRPNAIDLPPSSKNIPVGFKSNGKPAKVYHWNIPVLKKIVSSKHKSRNSDDYNDVVDFQNPENWNEVLDKSDHHKHHLHDDEVARIKPLKQSFYIPAKPKKASFMKYFPGNGKPHSFYVIQKNKKEHYHRLLP